VPLLREHKIASKWSQLDDFVFAGRIREKPRERNSVRTRVPYGAIEKANELLASEDRPRLPDVIKFHALRRTYAALRAELGEHPAITAAQMGRRDPRMTLRVYTDVTGLRPQTRMGGLLGDADWALSGTEGDSAGGQEEKTQAPEGPESRSLTGTSTNGSDGAGARQGHRIEISGLRRPERASWIGLPGPPAP
jgi:hypothetical protein